MTQTTHRRQDSTDTDKQTVTIPILPPRDPEAYRSTTHFGTRLRERVPENYRPTLPATLIREGRIYRLDIDSVEVGSNGAVVAFTTTGPKQRPWTLIAGLLPAAFSNEDERHRVITIFQGTPKTEQVAS
jgi:hypothetical protein